MYQESLFVDDSSLFPKSWQFEPVKPLLKRALNGFVIPDSRQPLINEAWNILEHATLMNKPNNIFLLMSGGYDSLVSTHISAILLEDTFRKYASFLDRIPKVHVLHIDTGIGVPQSHEYVRSVADQFGWHYLEYATPESYEENVLTYGFPGPAQHTTMYIKLKERALRLAIRDHTPPHPLEVHKKEMYEILNGMQQFPLLHQYVIVRLLRACLTKAISDYRENLRPDIFITGVRRSESVRRMGTVIPVQKRGRQLWLAPLTSWNKEDVLDYRDAQELPHSEVVDVLHKSSECLCGAFAKAGELEELCFWYPEVGAYIKDLERRVHATGFHWGWEEGPPRRKRSSRVHPDQLTLPGIELEDEGYQQPATPFFSPLCSSCQQQHAQETDAPSCSIHNGMQRSNQQA